MLCGFFHALHEEPAVGPSVFEDDAHPRSYSRVDPCPEKASLPPWIRICSVPIFLRFMSYPWRLACCVCRWMARSSKTLQPFRHCCKRSSASSRRTIRAQCCFRAKSTSSVTRCSVISWCSDATAWRVAWVLTTNPKGRGASPLGLCTGSTEEAIHFGRTFRQNSVVYCRDARPELIVTDPTCDEVGRTYVGNWRIRQ